MMGKELKNIEIFAVGKWKGDVYTTDDLDAMVNAYQELKSRVEPPLKLGHDFRPEAPAVGWITSVRRDGDKLLADIKDIPDEVYDAVEKKLYKKISAEIVLDYQDSVSEKTYPYVISGVALLGAKLPAITVLHDVTTHCFEGLVRTYTFDCEYKNGNLGMSVSSNALQTPAPRIFSEDEQDHVKKFINEEKCNGRILPRDESLVYAMLLNADSAAQLAFSEDEKPVSQREMIMRFIQSLPARVEFSQLSMAEEIQHASSPKDRSRQLAEHAKQYAHRHGVSYRDALLKIVEQKGG